MKNAVHRLKGNNWHKWSAEEHAFVVTNYKAIGDKKLAELMNERFPKTVHCWTRKQIEKRRNYFGLKRTKAQESKLRRENNKDGRHFRMWDTRGRAEQGEVRTYKGKLYMKAGRWFVPYHAAKYKELVGPVPKGMMVTRGFEVITREENATRNRLAGLGYDKETGQALRALNQLKKLLHGKENSRTKRYLV